MKLIKLTIALLMVLALAGCNNNETPIVDDTNINDSSTVIEDTANTNEDTTPETSNTESEISMGNWNESVYTNDFLNLKYTLPEGWISYSDEEIAKLMNVSSELAFGEKDFIKEIAKLTSVYYLFTQSPTNGNNVSVLTEKPLVDVTVEYYINQLKTQLAAMTTIKYEIGETSTSKIGDKDVTVLSVSAPDYNLLQKYYVYKVDEYFVGIVATSSTGEDGINEIISCFE